MIEKVRINCFIQYCNKSATYDFEVRYFGGIAICMILTEELLFPSGYVPLIFSQIRNRNYQYCTFIPVHFQLLRFQVVDQNPVPDP